MTAIERTDAAWLLDLRDPGPKGALAQRELRELIVRALHRGLARRPEASALIEDLAQESMLRILAKLDSFREESRFSTWAIAIALRVSFSALRRRHWRDVPLDALTDGSPIEAPSASGMSEPFEDGSGTPEQAIARREILTLLQRCVAETLSERQRQVVLAELRGMPQEEIAAQLGSNRNAIYKLCHDARRSLQRALEQAGYSAETVRWAFG
ncbi:RNA polymerase sigma factor [Sorangium sp. So ce1389]|uniref:RNA polymerase sigma factor n=1 Tax=Sorangium sp. So ce1389 TaxID=3133336 RepID=UPI003F6231E7